MESGLWSGLPLSTKLLTFEPWKKKVNTSCQFISYTTRSSGQFEPFTGMVSLIFCPWSQEVQYLVSRDCFSKFFNIDNTLENPETHVFKSMTWKLSIHTPYFSDSRSGVIRIFEAHYTWCLMKKIANIMEENPDKEHQKQTGKIISLKMPLLLQKKLWKTIKSERMIHAEESCAHVLCMISIQFVLEPIKETVKALWIWQKRGCRVAVEGFQDRHLEKCKGQWAEELIIT